MRQIHKIIGKTILDTKQAHGDFTITFSDGSKFVIHDCRDIDDYYYEGDNKKGKKNEQRI